MQQPAAATGQASQGSRIPLRSRLPLQLTYDLSRMQSKVRITLPQRFGGVSANLPLPGIGGTMALNVHEGTCSSFQVTLTTLDVSLGRIALPGKGGAPLRMVKLQLANDAPLPMAAIDTETGEVKTLEAVLEALSPRLLAKGIGGTRLRLSLTERLDLGNLSLHGSGVGAIEGGMLKGGIFTFSHTKPPPPPPQPPPPPATTWCLYNVIRGFPGLGLGTGDLLCVDCPPSGACPGSDSSDFTAAIVQTAPGGRQAEGMLRREIGRAACGACPPEGKKGYRFV